MVKAGKRAIKLSAQTADALCPWCTCRISRSCSFCVGSFEWEGGIVAFCFDGTDGAAAAAAAAAAVAAGCCRLLPAAAAAAAAAAAELFALFACSFCWVYTG